jgi:hypothetical protein
MKRPLDFDPLTGKRSTFEFDEGEDRALVHEVTDVTSVIEQNKRDQNDGTGGWNADKSLRHVARIPPAVCEFWRLVYGVNVLDKNHAPAVKRLLNDPDWRFLRTANWRF